MMLLLSFKNLFRNKRRTLAILFTIAIGIGVLFSFKGFIHGVLNNYRESTIHSHYGHGQIFTKGYRSTVYAKPWEHWMENTEAIETFLKSQDAVTHIFPRVNFPALLKNDHISISGLGQGIKAEEEATFFGGLNVEEGKTLKGEQDGILLGKGLAKALNVVPQDLVTLLITAADGTINQMDFVVTGIFHTGSQEFDNRIFRIQLPQAQKLLKTDRIELISIGLKDHHAWDTLALSLQSAFPTLESASFAELDKVYYQHSVDWLQAQFKVIQIIILSIVLLGIFNSVSASILERKQEIGNFRANGESISDVLTLIVAEGFFLGLLGSLIGVSLTFVFLKTCLDQGILMPPGPGLTRPFYISFQFEWHMVISSFLFAILSAVAASLLAGIKVATMPIAKALRSN